jgi:hypothetical protein
LYELLDSLDELSPGGKRLFEYTFFDLKKAIPTKYHASIEEILTQCVARQIIGLQIRYDDTAPDPSCEITGVEGLEPDHPPCYDQPQPDR